MKTPLQTNAKAPASRNKTGTPELVQAGRHCLLKQGQLRAGNHLVRFVVLVFLLISVSILTWGQTTNDYRSNVTTGNWGTTGSWQRYNGTSWVAATSAPTSTANVITIRNGHTITIAANVTVDQVVVEAGGQLTVGAATLTIANGTGTDLVVNGTVATTTSTAAAISLNSGATVAFNAGSLYQHNRTTGSIPIATWNVNSTCEIAAWGSSSGDAIGNINQNFGNLTISYSNTGSTGFALLSGGGTFSIQGNFTMNTTSGARPLRLNSSSTAATFNVGGNFYMTQGTFHLKNVTPAATLNITGDFIVGGGSFIQRNSSTSNAATINLSGNFNMNGGTYNMSSEGAVGSLNVSGDFSHTGGTITETSTGSGTIVFNGNGTPQTYTSGGSISNTINFTVNNGAFLQMAAAGTQVTGGGSFTLQSGATLGIRATDGIASSGAAGNIRVTGARTYTSGANYMYNGTTAQNTGNGLSQNTPANLTIDNPSTVTSNEAFSLNGNLNIQQGILDMQATDANYTIGGNLTVNSGATLKHSQDWDENGRQIIVNGNLSINGNYDYSTVGRTHIGMYGAGSKTISAPNTALSIVTLNDGNFSATGNLTINDNFWSMFGSSGSFSTNGQVVTANAGVLINGGTVNINGGTLNVTSGLLIGHGSLNGAVNLSNGTLNADYINIGNETLSGTLTQSGGTANIGNLFINAAAGNAYTCSGSPAINVSGNWTNNRSVTAFTPANSTITFNGSADQSIGGSFNTSFYNLTFANTGAAVTFISAHSITNNFSLTTGAVANLGTFTHTANTLTLSGNGAASGSWGGNTSSADNIDPGYFAEATGIINVTNNTCTGYPAVNINKTDLNCFGAGNGEIAITATGGTGTLYYSINGGTSWQPGNTFTGLPAGNYPVRVKDSNGCIQTNCTIL